MQTHKRICYLALLYITLNKKYPLLLPSHNCIITFQCSVFKVHPLILLRPDFNIRTVARILKSILKSFENGWPGDPGLLRRLRPLN